MFSKVFLAQTEKEAAEYPSHRLAYMALHFSPYGKGLSNVPRELPNSSILLLDDSMPILDHSPDLVAEQLKGVVAQFSPMAVLLDFQREKTPEAEQMVRRITQALSCPVGATEEYAGRLGCPVLLPPTPLIKTLEGHLSPWLGQGVFLEISTEGLEIAVAKTGSTLTPILPPRRLPMACKRLHCHYCVAVSGENALFTLGRTEDDLTNLCEEAEKMGVLAMVGLYQELKYKKPPQA